MNFWQLVAVALASSFVAIVLSFLVRRWARLPPDPHSFSPEALEKSEARRIQARLPLLIDHASSVEPLCGNCAHFDLEEGQAAQEQHHPWARGPMQWIPPAEIGTKKDENGNPRDAIPYKVKWTQFGLCKRRSGPQPDPERPGEFNDIREGGWSGTTAESRLKNYPPIDPEHPEKDCFEARLQ